MYPCTVLLQEIFTKTAFSKMHYYLKHGRSFGVFSWAREAEEAELPGLYPSNNVKLPIQYGFYHTFGEQSGRVVTSSEGLCMLGS
jgi:hypothetical protein